MAVPTADQMSLAYPALARIMQIEGRVKLHCSVETDARLDDCVVETEAPTGLGFGDAGLGLSRYFVMKPASLNGEAMKATWVTIIYFRLPKRPPPAPRPAVSAASPSALMLARQVNTLQNRKVLLVVRYQKRLDQEIGSSLSDSHSAEAEPALDSIRQAADKIYSDILEADAQRQAAQLGDANLAAVVAFLSTPAGRAWTQASEQTDSSVEEQLSYSLADESRRLFCARVSCDLSPSSAGAPKPKR